MWLRADAIIKRTQEFLSEISVRVFQQKYRRFLSVDFGRAVVKILYLEAAGRNLKLINYALKKMSPAEKDIITLRQFIINFIKTHSISEKEVYLSIYNPEAMIIRNLSLPILPLEEVVKAAQWELKYEAPFDLRKAIYDWEVVKEYTTEKGVKKNGIIFVAAEAKTIYGYISIVTDCGLQPTLISSGPFNYAHLLRAGRKDVKLQAILDIGDKEALLSVYKNDKLYFSRKIIFSSAKIAQALTTALATAAGRVALSYEKAEKIRDTFGIPEAKDRVLAEGITAEQVISLIRPLLEDLTRELRHSFDFVASRFQEQWPEVLYLTGGGANLKNLERYLSQELKINVSPLSIPDCVSLQGFRPEQLSQHRQQIINALAMALAERQAINLLPLEVKTQKVELIERVSLRLVTVAIAAILIFLLLGARLQINDYQDRLNKAQMHLQTLSEIKSLKEKIDLKGRLLKKIQARRIPAAGLLKEISILIPDDAILKKLSFSQSQQNLILKGTVAASEDMAEIILTEFMQEIEASVFFFQAALISSQKAGETQAFEIKCNFTR